MRIATITNWAYCATVCLTIASGIVMLMASNADNSERRAVEQRQIFDQLTEEVEMDAWSLSDLARLYVIGQDPDVLDTYRQKESALKDIEHRLSVLKDTGATGKSWRCCTKGCKLLMHYRMNSRRRLTVLPMVKKNRLSRCCTGRFMNSNSNKRRIA